jgi:HSP20 family protein
LIAGDEETGVQRIERATGRFLRRFTLPEAAHAEGIGAKSANGILEVTIPKAPEVQARRITVEAA